MKKQKLTDKQMLYMIVGKLTIKAIQFIAFEAIAVTMMIAMFNSMTVYR